jgi:ribonuclease HI
MGIGVSIQDSDGKEIQIVSLEVGQGTSNQAEFLAAIEGAVLAYEMDPIEVELVTDNELIVNAVNGRCSLHNEELQELHDELDTLLRKFGSVLVAHIAGDLNRRANRFARIAIKKQTVEL